MGLFDYLLGFQAETPSIFPHDANDERAWRSGYGTRDHWDPSTGGGLATTGQYVRPDDAIGVSCVFLGVRIYAKLLGTSPMRFYRNLPNDEGEDPVYTHPLLKVLAPDGRFNPWMTGALGRMWMEAQALLWGLGLCEIKFGGFGPELWPIEAEHVTQIDQLDSGKKRYAIQEPGKPGRYLVQDEVFALEGFGTHRLIPESLLRRSREAVAVWLAQQQYRGSYFERGAAPSVVLEHPGEFSDPARERFARTVQGKIGGLRNAHRLVVLEENIKLKEFGHTARNAQLVEAWDAQAREVARFLDLPSYMLEIKDQLPYNSRQQAMQEFLDLRLRPKAVLWEGAIKRDLITEPEIVCEIDLDYLKRGDALTQAQTDAIYIMNGVLDENEVRRGLGRNKLAGLDGPRRSVNQDKGGDPRQPRPGNPGDQETGARTEGMGAGATSGAADGALLDSLVPGFAAQDMIEAAEQRRLERTPVQTPPPPGSRDTPSAVEVQSGGHGAEDSTRMRMRKVLESSARQILRRETEQLRRRAIQHAASPSAWSAWLLKFYSQELSPMIQERLAVSESAARGYTDRHRQEVLKMGVGVCDRWEAAESTGGPMSGVIELVEMALSTEGR